MSMTWPDRDQDVVKKKCCSNTSVLAPARVPPRFYPKGTTIFPFLNATLHRGVGFGIRISMITSHISFFLTPFSCVRALLLYPSVNNLAHPTPHLTT